MSDAVSCDAVLSNQELQKALHTRVCTLAHTRDNSLSLSPTHLKQFC